MKKHLIGQLADLQTVQQFGKVDQVVFIEGKAGIDLIVGYRLTGSNRRDQDRLFDEKRGGDGSTTG